MSKSKTIRTSLNYVTETRSGSSMKPPTRAKRPEPAEFEQFAALTSKLVQVPKTELDEKRREED